MTKPIARDPIYRRRRFEAEIIELCVRWYITYRLSYRDLVAMMAERGLAVSHTTILRWVIRYVPEFEKRRADRRGTCIHPAGQDGARAHQSCGDRSAAAFSRSFSQAGRCSQSS